MDEGLAQGKGFSASRLYARTQALGHHWVGIGRRGDRTYKLGSGTTSEYGRYVKSLGEPRGGSEADQ